MPAAFDWIRKSAEARPEISMPENDAERRGSTICSDAAKNEWKIKSSPSANSVTRATAESRGMHRENKVIQILVTILWGLSDYNKYSAVLDQMIGKVVDYINNNPELRTIPTEDMFVYSYKEYDVTP